MVAFVASVLLPLTSSRRPHDRLTPLPASTSTSVTPAKRRRSRQHRHYHHHTRVGVSATTAGTQSNRSDDVSPSSPLSLPPTSVPETAARAAAAVDRALAAGHRRIRVDALVPGLNPIAEDTYPFSIALQAELARAIVLSSEALGTRPTIHLLFASAGEAAAAAATYARSAPPQPQSESASEVVEPDSPVAAERAADGDGQSDDDASGGKNSGPVITTRSYAGRDVVPGRVSSHVNVLVAPVSSRGDPIMDDLEAVLAEPEAADAVWVLFNARLDNDRAAVGMAESSRRAAFLTSFEQAFYFRNLFEIQRPRLVAVERGALLFAFGDPWRAFGLVGNEYVLAGERDSMPAGGPLDAMVRRARSIASRQRTQQEVAAAGDGKGASGAQPGGLQGFLQNLFGGSG